MKILVSGSTGLVGEALMDRLKKEGHEGLRLVRRASRDGVLWDPAAGDLDGASLEGVEAVVHLAGENIASGRWSASRKQRILRSRVDGTTLLSTVLAGLRHPPRVLVSASAIGFYGNRGDTWVDEASPAGEGFLAEVCQAWEAAAEPARRADIRVVHPRLGVVLSDTGGALAKMLTPFRLGLGGRIGDGGQWVSWIALQDLVSLLLRLVEDQSLAGPVNAVSPRPVTNRGLTEALATVLGRPAVIPLPAFGVRLAMGKMADELLLASTRVRPDKLLESHFHWRYPELGETLRDLLG